MIAPLGNWLIAALVVAIMYVALRLLLPQRVKREMAEPIAPIKEIKRWAIIVVPILAFWAIGSLFSGDRAQTPQSPSTISDRGYLTEGEKARITQEEKLRQEIRGKADRQERCVERCKDRFGIDLTQGSYAVSIQMANYEACIRGCHGL